MRAYLNMRTLHTKTYFLVLPLFGVILLVACAGIPRHTQIAQSEGLTLDEKIQELVSNGASRMEVIATLGLSTGYTHDTLSYTIWTPKDQGRPGKLSYPSEDLDYDDPGKPGANRLVLAFDARGSLYKYHRMPVATIATGYWKRHRHYLWKMGILRLEWPAAYRTGFTALECIDREHCWAVGGAGLVLETTDGGKSWVLHPSRTDEHKHYHGVVPSIYSASFPDSMNGWLVGHDSAIITGGLILHSPDGGKNWSFQVKSGNWAFLQHSLWSIAFNDNRQGWAVGVYGTILHTSDGGSTWTAQSRVTKAALLSVGFCNGQSGWAVGSSWTILHTSDAGQSWRSQTISADELPNKTPVGKPLPFTGLLSIFPYEDVLTSLSVIDCRQGWIVGDHGAILHTEDGGVTWVAQPSGTTERLNAVQFISTHQGWAVGNRGVILKTIDGGKSWIPQASGTRENLHGLSFVDTDHGWIGGSYGVILHTSDGGTTWTKQCLVYDCVGEAAQKFYWHPWL